MKEQIVVIGGYGHVGQTICMELGKLFPGNVFAAGRNLDRAEQFSRSTDGKVRPLQLDINGMVDINMLENVKLVIMCLDQTNTAFVRFCFEEGIHYIDISANYSFLSQVEKLHEVALSNQATAVLSIGLTPGLTNLLASRAKDMMDKTDSIDISVMLGLGDQHGRAAIEWTIDNLNTNYDVVENGNRTEVASFTDGKETDFGKELGRRKAYRFNFSDQHALPRTLGVPSVSTRLCFDSVAVTGLIRWLRVLGAFHLLRYSPVRNAVIQLFLSKTRIGQEIFAVKIDAKGGKGHEDVHVECLVLGKREAEMTAKIAVAVAEIVYRSSLSHGVFHVEQLFDIEDIFHGIHREVFMQTMINGIQIH